MKCLLPLVLLIAVGCGQTKQLSESDLSEIRQGLTELQQSVENATQRIADLESRIAELESQPGGVRVSRSGEFAVVTAQSIQVVDSSGRPRVTMACIESGDAGLTVSAEDGTPRYAVVLSPDGKLTQVVFDGEGRDRLSMNALDDVVSLILRDLDGQTRLGLSTTSNGAAGFVLYDSEGNAQEVLLSQ